MGGLACKTYQRRLYSYMCTSFRFIDYLVDDALEDNTAIDIEL